MLPALEELLRYKNEKIIQRYLTDYKDNKLTPEDALEELLKYFWLTQKHSLDKNQFPNTEELDFMCAIHDEMSEIDDMWHTFLLFTREYMHFCNHYFGTYIHHIPTAEDEYLAPAEFEINFGRYLSYIYDNLGEQTVIKWFESNE